jgi:hypothetical protein
MAHSINPTRSIALFSLLALLAASPAHAVKRGLYVGGSVGGASTEPEDSVIDFDEYDTAWKAFVGYHFLQFFAVEASYRDLGSPDATDGTDTVAVSTTAYDVAGLVGTPLGPIYLWGKFGLTGWDSDITTNDSKTSDDGSGYLAGVGVSIDVIKIQVRAEVEYLDAAEGSVMYTVGAAWRF